MLYKLMSVRIGQGGATSLKMETGVLRPAIGAVVAVYCRRLRAGGQFRGCSVCPRPQNYAGPANHCRAAAPRLERLLSVPRVDRGALPFRSRAPPFAVPFWADLVKYPRRGGVVAGRPSCAGKRARRAGAGAESTIASPSPWLGWCAYRRVGLWSG